MPPRALYQLAYRACQLARRLWLFIPLLFLGSLGGSASQARDLHAPPLEGMGDYHHAIATEDPLVQRFFDQGLVLAYGFNHREAERAFREAARLDPQCAMCWWGVALVLGPNINAAMPPEHNDKAWAAMHRAVSLKEHASERHQAYIEALTARYAQEPPQDRSALDQAYAKAMGEVAECYPQDPDALTLYGEALMDTTPWDYWQTDGSPKPVTETLLAAFESALEHNPDHPGANHLYIHAVEAQQPERGLPMAKRLENLVPGVGHLVHMPSHIYIRTGDYHAASLANERAVAVDQAYIAQYRPKGLYPLAYVPHNWHFLWAATTLEGRSKRAVKAAYETRKHVDAQMMTQPGFGTLQHYYVLPLYAYLRFGQWDEVLAADEPPAELPYPRAVWHYARGLAHLGTDQLARAEAELIKLRKLATDPRLEEVTLWEINPMSDLIAIAVDVLTGELDAKRGDYKTALARLRAGVAKEEALNYDEPPDWYYPVRHSLGAVLLEADRPQEAEAVYRADLKAFPENGWALFGLWQSLDAQGDWEQAKAVYERFERAWRHADIELTASRFL